MRHAERDDYGESFFDRPQNGLRYAGVPALLGVRRRAA
jgi:hypothetical protein